MIGSEHILLFDGVCNLCNSLVKFIIKRDPQARFRFASLQSETAVRMIADSGLVAKDLDTVVYFSGDKLYLKSAAVLHLLKDLGGYWKFFYGFSIIPGFILDLLYDLVARTRYKFFGRTEICMVPTPDIKERFLT